VATSNPLAAATARQLSAAVATAQRDGRLPSLVGGIVRDGGLAWSCGRGSVDGAEPDTGVQYRIGSITKSLTAVAVMRLRDEGRLSLGDPVDGHVAGTPFGDRTIGQLLSHLAGLRAESPGEWWERTPGLPWDRLAAGLTEGDAVLAAGRQFHYSNLGYGLLGELVGRLRGRPWADVVRDEVLLPLGMTRTTTRPVPPAARGWAVHPWADVVLPEPEHDAQSMAPAGQLWSTLADLARWSAFLLGDHADVLSEATLAEMMAPAGVDPVDPEWAAYGLGLQVVRRGGRAIVGHGGSMPGFLAAVFVEPEEGVGVVVLANATSGLDPQLLPRMFEIVRDNEPTVVAPWTPLTSVDPAVLALAGTWYWGTYGYGLRVRFDEMLELIPLASHSRGSRFRPQPDGSWVGLDGYHAGETLRPRHDAAGELVALDIGTFVFTREPYDRRGPVPGGVDDAGWRPGPV
jgi:CubicO group peptidase (beta-lactamase class C family)